MQNTWNMLWHFTLLCFVYSVPAFALLHSANDWFKVRSHFFLTRLCHLVQSDHGVRGLLVTEKQNRVCTELDNGTVQEHFSNFFHKLCSIICDTCPFMRACFTQTEVVHQGKSIQPANASQVFVTLWSMHRQISTNDSCLCAFLWTQ